MFGESDLDVHTAHQVQHQSSQPEGQTLHGPYICHPRAVSTQITQMSGAVQSISSAVLPGILPGLLYDLFDFGAD